MHPFLLGAAGGIFNIATLGSTIYAAKHDPSFRNLAIGATIVLVLAIVALYYASTNKLKSPFDPTGFGFGMVVLMFIYSGLGLWSWPFTFKALLEKYNTPLP